MPLCLNLISGIGVTASTGVGGIAVLGTGRCCHNRQIGVLVYIIGIVVGIDSAASDALSLLVCVINRRYRRTRADFFATVKAHNVTGVPLSRAGGVSVIFNVGIRVSAGVVCHIVLSGTVGYGVTPVLLHVFGKEISCKYVRGVSCHLGQIVISIAGGVRVGDNVIGFVILNIALQSRKIVT